MAKVTTSGSDHILRTRVRATDGTPPIREAPEAADTGEARGNLMSAFRSKADVGAVILQPRTAEVCLPLVSGHRAPSSLTSPFDPKRTFEASSIR